MGGGPRPRLAVIDLGGTMVADGWLVNAAIHSSLAEAGIPVTAELMAQLRGRDRRTALARAAQAAGVDNAAAAQAMQGFGRRVLMDVKEGRYRLYAGVEHALSWLRLAEVKVVATTNFAVDVRDALLAVTGLAARIDGAVSTEELAAAGATLTRTAMQRSAIIDAAEVASIGDTREDLEKGREAGVGWNIAVLTGRDDLARLAPVGDDVVVAHVCEAVAYLLGGAVAQPRAFHGAGA